jgi:hypothetical protein
MNSGLSIVATDMANVKNYRNNSFASQHSFSYAEALAAGFMKLVA